MKQITILENDQIHEHCPLADVLLKIQKITPTIEYTLWDWFGQDCNQNKESSVKRLSELSNNKDHAFLSYPSFIGYDNTFSGWVWYLNKLKEQNIKLNIYLVYGSEDNENLLYYTLSYLFNEKGYDNYKKTEEELFSVLKYHEIHYSTYVDVSMFYYSRDKEKEVLFKSIFDIFKPLNFDEFQKNWIKKGDKVRIKETGEIKEVKYVLYYHKEDSCHFDLIMDEEKDLQYQKNESKFDKSAYQEFKLSEIEKI